jgi:hypothetical protein
MEVHIEEKNLIWRKRGKEDKIEWGGIIFVPH